MVLFGLEEGELVWSGNLNQAKNYFSGPVKLPPGIYLTIIDFSAIPDPIFLLVKTAKDVELTINRWLGKGIREWCWDGKRLLFYVEEHSPIAPAIIYAVVVAITAISGVLIAIYSKDILVELRRVIAEAGPAGKILMASAGAGIVGGTVYLLWKGR